MIKNHAAYLAGLMACLGPLLAMGGQLGEPAPPLVVKQWLKGGPVEVKPGTNVYVVEIWGTWSSASRATITNLSELQKRFKDKGVVVAAISDEGADKMKAFLQNEGTNINYAVAADDLGQTSRTYMLPLQLHGVPHTFVVGTNGTLLWHGPPSPTLVRVLDQVTSGRFELERAKQTDTARHQMEQYLTLAQRGDKRTALAGRRLLEARTNDVAQLCELAFQIATNPRIAKRDFALADESLNQAEKLQSTNATLVVLTRAVLLFETGKQDEALARAKAALASAKTPKEKQEAQSCLRTMEARLARQAAAKGHSPAGSNTNQAVILTNRADSSANSAPPPSGTSSNH